MNGRRRSLGAAGTPLKNKRIFGFSVSSAPTEAAIDLDARNLGKAFPRDESQSARAIPV